MDCGFGIGDPEVAAFEVGVRREHNGVQHQWGALNLVIT